MSVHRFAYNPALDGLRAVAIVLVLLSHAHAPLFSGAFFGVDLFFVLSGYLITSLLLREVADTGRIDYWDFYRRRFFRLMPALLLFLAAYCLAAPRIWPELADVYSDAIVSALYLADYGIAFFDSPGTLLHMWSLAVEEHFYLLWPPLLMGIIRRAPKGTVWRTLLLLFLMTGSLVIPLKALLASALSLGASIGLLVWGFQDGAFAGLMGFDPGTVYGVDTLVVLLTLVFGFGLAMDYEMFILSRVKEQRDAGAGDEEAIALGLQHSGRIITSAALIIIVVFAGFATGDLMIIKQLGVALAFAVLLDATLVRCLLVPAFMTWQRRIMWWAPTPLRRLHARFGLSE